MFWLLKGPWIQDHVSNLNGGGGKDQTETIGERKGSREFKYEKFATCCHINIMWRYNEVIVFPPETQKGDTSVGFYLILDNQFYICVCQSWVLVRKSYCTKRHFPLKYICLPKAGVWEFLFSADFLVFKNFLVPKFQPFSFIFSLFLAFYPDFTLFFLVFLLWCLTPLQKISP